MNSIWHITPSLIIFFLGCRFYAKFIVERIFRLDPKLKLRLISLLLITIWLKRLARPVIFTSIPMGFLLTMTLWAMLRQLIFEWSGLGQRDASLLLFFPRSYYFGYCYLDFGGICEFTVKYEKNNYF